MSSSTPNRYSPGTARALVWPGGAALVDASLSAEAAGVLWLRLNESGPAPDVGHFLTALADATGVGLLALPSFAVATLDPDGVLHLAARGHLTVTTARDPSSATGSVLDGSAVATWSELRVHDAYSVTLSAGGAGGAGGADVPAAWPLVAGVVCADLLVWQLGTDPAPRAPLPPVEESVEESVDAPVDSAVSEPTPEPDPEPDAEPDPEPEPQPEPDAADEFDHLWGDHTILGDVESAAIRSDDPPAPPPARDVPPSVPDDATWTEDSAEPMAELAPASSLPTPSTPPAFIDSVPGASPAPPPVRAHPAPPTLPPPVEEPAPDLGDHDGETILQLPSAASAEPSPTPTDGSGITGVRCSSGHGNPPQRPRCRVCGEELTGVPTRIERPVLGRMITSTGDTVDLGGPVIIGRAPRAARFTGTEIPRLVAIPHPHISASHAALRIDGWSVLVVDLNSTNGTFLRRGGQPPFRILDKPELLVEGDVVDLGHGIHLRFEELP